ncbi:MAG: methylated-DNA--[protein]-cysteine S-methyltransferase [Chloroflexota bacterium]|nr:MAG: methylated-DNA--protein-cysteine methyltransferase [Bellilinea sp.]
MFYYVMQSPIGELLLSSDGEFLRRLSFFPFELPLEGRKEIPLFKQAHQQLEAYFAGELRSFDLPIYLEGSAFQRKVWGELIKIPYGTTISYKQLAERVGDIKAIRAVGKANGQNPLPIIVPCHRVVGSNGNLIGYGGGVEKKLFLLKLENSLLFV